jgi:hypothetical protein
MIKIGIELPDFNTTYTAIWRMWAIRRGCVKCMDADMMLLWVYFFEVDSLTLYKSRMKLDIFDYENACWIQILGDEDNGDFVLNPFQKNPDIMMILTLVVR